ncbi:hypothetical protein [Laribacter hongkongensis]|uniref:Uncharacterized protein n=1 Tax=Laribacter hongkongensis TaxID=168471 RepID=A0ABD4STC3_9NEIS|nr:hypothetical protein [Laribacter hongkongensis]MCG9026044.1 hypothetical protein [Laribacter hongkongensis]MCG9116302.1 hypothetical protein [Laribacter hongkongensis]MCG9124941.1 hypothetical protein [Laribacter hongkongensis]
MSKNSQTFIAGQGWAVPALAQLLEVENEEALLQPVCPVTGIPVWSVVRNQFFRLVMSDLLYSTQPLLSTTDCLPRARIVRAALRSIAHNLAQPPQRASLLIRATGVGLIERDGRSFNRYTDYFAGAATGGAWSYEDLASWDWPTLPRNGGVSYTTAAFAVIRLCTQFGVSTAQRALAQQVVGLAVSRAERLLDWTPGTERRAWLEKHAARRLAALPLQRATMRGWLRRVRPALFLVEEGCYGQMAAFNAAAREQGVLVAEFQHGSVTVGHDVYNVAPALAASAAYRRGLPDVFLGYGSWWNEQFNLPLDKRVIGNPHREAILQTMTARNDGLRRVLILGDGRELQAHLDLCRALVTRLPAGWEVLFRPHPEERRAVLAMDGAAFAGFGLDRESDIYASLAQSEAVVAELSTGLFEGVGLARRIFVWDTPKSRFGLPNHPFARFSDAAALATALQVPQEGDLAPEQRESIWASDWRTRFSEFLAACGASPQ